jgi:hypothetical protein
VWFPDQPGDIFIENNGSFSSWWRSENTVFHLDRILALPALE